MKQELNKRDRIFESALQLFAERGFDATTIPMIATDAKVGAGTIYRYFENKEVLVNTLFQFYVNSFKEKLLSGFPSSLSIREQFHHIFQGMIQFTNYHEHALYFIKTHNAAYFLDETSKAVFEELMNNLRNFVEHGQKENSIRELPSAALIAIIFGGFLELHQLVRSGEIEATSELLAGVEESCWDAVRVHQ